MVRKVVQAEEVAKAGNGFNQGMLVEGKRLYFISGQGPVDADGNLVGKGDLAAQSHQVFTNLRAQLAAVGADFSNVVKFTFFIKQEAMQDFGLFREIRLQYLEPDYPAATAVGIGTLVNRDWLVEIEAIAILD